MSRRIILNTPIKSYIGKTVVDITDWHGNKLQDLVMADSIVVHFSDGTELCLATDWRGDDCYISAYTPEVLPK